MACRSEFESEEAWGAFLEKETEPEAYDALGEVLDLAQSFARYGKATSDRMHRFLDLGEAIYAKRFGREWVPF